MWDEIACIMLQDKIRNNNFSNINLAKSPAIIILIDKAANSELFTTQNLNNRLGTTFIVINNVEQCYKVLGLEVGASLKEINQAYKDLVFIWHPDRLPQENQRLQQKSAEKIKEINHARDLLRSFHSQKATTPSQSQPKTSQSNYQPRNSYYYQQSSARSYRQQQSRRTSSSTNSHNGNGGAKSRYYSTSHQEKSQQSSKQASSHNYYYQKHSHQASSHRRGANPKAQSINNNTYKTTNFNCYRPYYKDMSGIDLKGANLKEKDLSGRNLYQANLQDADLSDGFLHKVILEEANLQGANLFRANLLQANLRNANLKGSNLVGADLSGADLSGADLSGAKVGSGNRIMVKLTGAKLAGTIFPNGFVNKK